VLRSSLVVATLGGLVATGVAALPAQADHIATAGSRGSVNTASTAHIHAVLAAIAAARHRLGTLTGVVVGADGRPLTGACVTATGAAGNAMTMTRADGRYVLAGLRPGRYTIRYTGCGRAPRSSGHPTSSLGFQAQPAATATAPSITVVGGVKSLPTMTLAPAGPGSAGDRPPRSAITASASGTGQIRGVVTGNGHPVGGVCVEAEPVRSGFGRITTTSANGHYTLRKVLAGRYFVEFAESGFFGCRDPGNWLSQWYRGITSPFMTGKETVVRVAKGTVTRGINASLRRGGEISGTVRSKSGRPLKAICVTVSGRVAHGYTEAMPRTGKLGKYVVHGLFKGSYVVGFRVCRSGGNFAPQWWRHASTERAATHIHVSGSRKVTGIDGALAPGSAIAGVVHGRSLSGPRLRGICVDASNFHTGVSAEGRTNRNGEYKLVGLSAGTYFVQYQTGCGNRGNYLELGRKVTVGKGQIKRGVDVALQLGAGLSGTVTNTHGKPVGGICIDMSSDRGSGFGDIETNPDGTYRATGLNPGTYTVQFSGCDNRGSYVPQYYKGKSSEVTADPVKLIAGHITTGIDATMQPGATISGVLVNAAGHRLSGVCVGIDRRSDKFFSVDGEFTDIEFTTNGSYRAKNLSPGAYSVNFGCGVGSLASQWFKSRRTGDSADLVSASRGQVTSGVGAVMHPAGSITGTVTNRAGKPLNRICELAVPVGQPYPAVIGNFGPVTRQGTYHIGHLVAGRYDVQFFDCSLGDGGRYGSQWYRAKRTQGSATRVLVRQGRATPHIDAKLGVGGSIAGRVVNHTGQPVRSCVEAFDPATDSLGFVLTDRAGNYKITGLSTGTYQILAAKCFGGNEAYTTRPASVRVRAPQALSGINVRLPAGGSITGTVLAGSPSAARSDVCVVIVPVKANGSFGLAATKPDGTYRVSGLATGQYQVNFADPNCFFSPNDDLAPQWFNDQQTQATANDVTVTAGATTVGISATLVTNGSISGSVTDQAHAPVGGECVTAVPVGAVPDPLLLVRQRPEIAVSAAKGHYSLVGVLPGRYKIEFSPGCGGASFKTQWWKNADSAAAATVITVGAGALVTGIDAELKH
jgi:protocatechuate 3,4-dioxygenase beta subunit